MTTDHDQLLKHAREALDAGTQTPEEVVPRLMAALKANPSATAIKDYLTSLYQEARTSLDTHPAWVSLMDNDPVIMRLLDLNGEQARR